MHDLVEGWTSTAGPETASIETDAGSIRILHRQLQYLVSGNIAEAAGVVDVDPQGIGALGLVMGLPYSVRVARDRMLFVIEGAAPFKCGWNDAGYAVTDMSAGLAVVEISGRLANEIMRRATTLPLSGKGPSAAIKFAGIDAYVYYYGETDRMRVHLCTSLLPHILDWFGAIMPAICGVKN